MDEETKTTEQPTAQENQKPDAPAKEPPAKETKPEPKAEPQDAAESAQDAPESPGADEVASLRAQLARANMMSTAAIEAAKLGVEAGQIPYVLRLAELPESGKAEDIAAAVNVVDCYRACVRCGILCKHSRNGRVLTRHCKACCALCLSCTVYNKVVKGIIGVRCCSNIYCCSCLSLCQAADYCD